MIALKIRRTVITARYGTLASGDILRTDEAFARHLVEDCDAASYLETPAAATAVNPEKPAKTPRRKTKE